jgi:hypothetical protein
VPALPVTVAFFCPPEETHDRAIAQQTDRMIEVSDGLVSQDVRNDYLESAVRRA